jgi:hypothetical protein
MKTVRTAKGLVIDMGALAKVNETARAVSPGNVSMNARGDRLDASGNVTQTVQAVARAQHNTTTAPEKRKLSDAPGNTSKPAAKPSAVAEQIVVREEEKSRDDGSHYLEIEYEDGSMDVKELK